MLNQLTSTKPSIVNGIDVNALLGLVEAVKDDANQGKTHWRVTSVWQGQTWTRTKVDGFSIGGARALSRQFSLDLDEPHELGGSNRFANPQEYLLAALNACMVVGYVAQCALHGISLEKLEIETNGDIDLRGFFGIDPGVPSGYDKLDYVVRIRGDGTKEQFAEIHKAVMATSPNFYNLSNAVKLEPTLVVE